MKTCSKCKIEKPLTMFSTDRSRKDQKCGWCKDCSRSVHKKLKGHRRYYSIKSTYGLSKDDYDRMMEAQAGVCAICKQPPLRISNSTMSLHVDHCHKSGKVRGLLCNKCNSGIGFLQESHELATEAANYLKMKEY